MAALTSGEEVKQFKTQIRVNWRLERRVVSVVYGVGCSLGVKMFSCSLVLGTEIFWSAFGKI